DPATVFRRKLIPQIFREGVFCIPQLDYKALQVLYIIRFKQQVSEILGSIVSNKTDQRLGQICQSAGLRKFLLRHNFLEPVSGVSVEISDKRAVRSKMNRFAAFRINK